MTSAWIILLLLVAFVLTRLFRSTKMWWTFVSVIMAGLLVGMLSKEVVERSKKADKTTSITQLVNTIDDLSVAIYMQSLVEGDSNSTAASQGLQVMNRTSINSSDALTNITDANGRDSPYFEDDS